MNPLDSILVAKEDRLQQKLRLIEGKRPLITLTFNIPGYPKSSDVINDAFITVLGEFKKCLLAHRIIICNDEESLNVDAAGNIYMVPLQDMYNDLIRIKGVLEGFESNHKIGRIIDADLNAPSGETVSSGKMKKCHICDDAAIICMKEKRHSYDELRGNIFALMKSYLDGKRQDFIIKRISALITKTIVLEVSLSPKAGLVDYADSGIHQDMDYVSFVGSSSVLSRGFERLAQKSKSFHQDNIHLALPSIRQIGLDMEEEMNHETFGVNTQKGLIFLLGLSAFVSAFIIRHEKSFSFDRFIFYLKKLCAGLIELEFDSKSVQIQTHGFKCFEKYGVKIGGGARKEAEDGFPTAFEFGIPVFQKYLPSKFQRIHHKDMSRAMNACLLSIMANNMDTNILFRSSFEVLSSFQKKSKKAFESIDTLDFDQNFSELNDFCLKNRISAGGSADLLSVSVFLSLLDWEINCSDQKIRKKWLGNR